MTTDLKTENAIELVNVTKRYRQETAVADLTLRIPHGVTFGFLGPNGAGKTTTIKLLMGMLRRNGGEVHVLGTDPVVDPRTVRENVGYVPEQNCVHRWMRVYEAIDFCSDVYRRWNAALALELMTRLGLDREKKVGALSKGMLAKLSLVLALSHEPEVLLLDEPLAGLDPLAREEFLDGVLREMCDRPRTIVFSSHTLADVQRMADRVGIIHEGQLLVECAVDTLLERTKRIRAVLSNGSVPTETPTGTLWQEVRGREWLLTVADFSPQMVNRLREANDLQAIEVIDLNLEDIFKDYIRGRRATV